MIKRGRTASEGRNAKIKKKREEGTSWVEGGDEEEGKIRYKEEDGEKGKMSWQYK